MIRPKTLQLHKKECPRPSDETQRHFLQELSRKGFQAQTLSGLDERKMIIMCRVNQFAFCWSVVIFERMRAQKMAFSFCDESIHSTQRV